MPPHQENMRVLGVILIIFWLTTSSGDGQAGYFATPFLAQERLVRQRDAFGVLNSTAWGDFNPRLATDPPNGTEATRYLNITGFRQADKFAWEDLGRFKERCLEWSRSTSHMIPAPTDENGEQLEGGHELSAWDLGIPGYVWQNATGLVKGPWIRRNGSVQRTWTDYNFTAMTPSIAWAGTHSEWNRNVTGAEGSMQLRVEDKKRHAEYEDEAVDVEHGRRGTGGFVREVAAGLTVEDPGSGGTYEIRLHGVHWPRQGNMLLTTTSEKFGGIFGLPHLAPDENYFRSSQKLLNQTIDEILLKKERSAFTDQSNPWTSTSAGADDAWNPSPHCEYVVYLQVHAIKYEVPSWMPFWENPQDLVHKIEAELRNPTGTPISHVPELQMSAVVYSPDCAYFLESKGPPHFTELAGNNHLVGFKEEIWIWDVNLFILMMAAIVFGQIFLLKSQMKESYTPSTLGRISFWTLMILVLADGMMFAIAAVIALDSTHFYLRDLILMFALFMSMTIGGAFLGEVYKTQESEWRPREREHTAHNNTPRPPSTPAPPPGDPLSLPLPVTAGVARNQPDIPIIIPSDQDVDAEIMENLTAGAAAVPTAGTTGTSPQQHMTSFSTIVGRLILFGSFVCFLSLAAMSWWKPIRNAFTNTMVFVYLSFWVPQLVRNTKRHSRRAFSWSFMVGQSALRILPVAYFYTQPNNLILSETDWTAFLVLLGWLWLQLVSLWAQDIVGPRFGMPKGWMPEAWDYHQIMREDAEEGGLPIGLAVSPASPTGLGRVRSLSFGTSGERAKGAGATRMRTMDCAICFEVLEVPVVRAGEEADGGVAGMLERRKYMYTPCRHIFHSMCLEGWLRFRLQCPICREELPPL
ncbi:unnamed protein product [Discula destructiva]